MRCYIWYSEDGPGRGLSSLYQNVTAHASTVRVPVTVLLYNYGPLLRGSNLSIKPTQKELLAKI